MRVIAFMIVKISIYLFLTIGSTSALSKFDFSKDEQSNSFVSKSILGEYTKFAISSDAPGCAASGKRMISLNGTVVDAAVATLLCNGLVNMHSMGVGGGFIMVYYKASEKKSYVLDSRETAPAAASQDMFVNLPKLAKTIGPLAIAIPSEIKGLFVAWKRFGRLPWAILFEDAISMAKTGAIVSQTLDNAIKTTKSNILEGSGLQKMLYNELADRFVQAGELIVRPKLAAYLQSIAANPEGVLSGEWDVDVADDLRDAGSIVTLKDLVAYRPEWREPIRMPIRSGPAEAKVKTTNFELHTAPPPSSGVLVGLALNMMAMYNCNNSSSQSDDERQLYYQRLLETFKVVFAKRSYLSDESFLSVDAKQLLQNLETLSFAEQLQKQIQEDQTAPIDRYGSVFGNANDQGTSHVSIIGPNGDGLSITSTVNTWFGSTVVGERTGILFNNEMDDFSSPYTSDTYNLPAAPANFIRPGKRPLSSMSPIIVTQNKTVRLVIGGSGGSQIITSVIMSAVGNLHCNLNIKESIDASRVHHQLLPNQFLYELNLPKDILEGLKSRGHEAGDKRPAASVQGIEVVQSSFQNIERPSRGSFIRANADYRKGGDTTGL